MYYLIGIDDTDNNGTPSTGVLALQLGLVLEKNLHGRLLGVTSHQLLLHPSITHTSQNRCACILLEADSNTRRDIELLCRQSLLRGCAPGSDPGFALAPWSHVDLAIIEWGNLAKKSVLQRQEALRLARKFDISIAGFTGSGLGVIGALAAVGLCYDGNDGHYLWLPGLMDLKGILKASEIMDLCRIDQVENRYNRRPMPNDRIFFPGETHPLVRENQPLLLLQSAPKGEPYDWIALSEW